METVARNKNRKFTLKFNSVIQWLPIPATARSKAWFWGRSPAGIADSNPTGGMDVFFLDFCVLSGRGLCEGPIQGSHTEGGLSERDRGNSYRRPRHTGAVEPWEKNNSYCNLMFILSQIPHILYMKFALNKHETANDILPDVANRLYKSVLYLKSHILSR